MSNASRSHETTANRIAQQHGVDYNKSKGPDVKAPHITVEVETQGNVSDGIRQLQGHGGPVYIAGANRQTVDKALNATQNTTVEVMDSQGRIVKPSTRR
jgi:hypothetical protein